MAAVLVTIILIQKPTLSVWGKRALQGYRAQKEPRLARDHRRAVQGYLAQKKRTSP